MRCPRCSGNLMTDLTGEVSCINCSHVVTEGKQLPSLLELGGVPIIGMPLRRRYNVVLKEEDEGP